MIPKSFLNLFLDSTLRSLEDAHQRLLFLVLLKITEETGCLPPCSYIEYRIQESMEIVNKVWGVFTK